MDNIYVGNDISFDYHYAIFGNGYVDLFNNLHPKLNDEFYRIYFYPNKQFYYEHRFADENYSYVVAQNVNVSNKIYYRQDFFEISFCFCAGFLALLFIINIVTSVIRKGGVLGGLL